MADLDEQFDKAASLSLDDILLNDDERAFFWECLVHTVLTIVVHHGGHSFHCFRKVLQKNTPASQYKIKLHKTNVFPLPAMNINESSTAGNAEVMEAVLQELHLDMSMSEFAREIKLVAGDQLSLAHLRSVGACHAGNEAGASALQWALFVPGLFHYKIAVSHGFITTHLRQPNHLLTTQPPSSLTTQFSSAN